jgi:putative peptidoglycan lipid II flippase
VAGSLAAINFAWLLMLLPQGVFAQSIATAAFPTFSTQAAKGQVAEMRSTLAATLRAILYLALPAAVGLVVLSRPLVQLVFERGAFTETSTEMVAWALAFFALGLPAHAVVEIVVRAFYAMHDTKTPVMVGVGSMVLNVILSLVFIQLFRALGWMEHGGLALSNSLATTLEMVVLIYLIRQRLAGLEGRRMLASLVRIGTASLLMGIVAAGLAWLLNDYSVWLTAGVAVVLSIAEYIVSSLALKSPEPWAVWNMVTRRARPVAQPDR